MATVRWSASCEGMRTHEEKTAKAPRSMVTIADAAELLGVSVWTVRRRIGSGELTAYRLGNRIIRVRVDEVEALMTPVGGVRHARRTA